MMVSKKFCLLQVALIGVAMCATSVEANIGGACTATQNCTVSDSVCLGGFCCDPAHSTRNALACASGSGTPLFAMATPEPKNESEILNMITDNWQIVAGGGGGLLLLIIVVVMYIKRVRKKHKRRQEQHLASQAPLPTHQHRSHDAKIKPPTAHHHMASSGALRRKASDLLSILSSTASTRGQGFSNHTSASSESTASGPHAGHGRKASRFASAHTLIDPETFQSGGSMRRNPSSQSMNPNFETSSSGSPADNGLRSLDGSRWRMLSRAGSTLSRKESALSHTGSTLSRTGSTLKWTGTTMKRRMGSFESIGSFASSLSGSATGTVSYFGRHLTRVQSRMQHSGRSRLGSFFGSSEDLVSPDPKTPPRRPTTPKPQINTVPPPGLGEGNPSSHSSCSRADEVPMPVELMPSSLMRSNRDMMLPPPGIDSYSGSQFIPPPPPPPLPMNSSFNGDLDTYV